MTYSINNSSQNRNNGNSSFYGAIGSIASCIILFLIMWFYVMPYTSIPQPVEEEGLMISFGDNDNGGGQGDELMGAPTDNPAPSAAVETTTPPKSTPVEVKTVVQTTSTPKPTTNQDYITQSEASLAIAEKAKKNQEKQAQQAIENARIANDKRIADKKQKEQDAINKASSSMSGLFGNSTSAGNGNGTGTGSGTGPEHQGNPAGKGYSGGHSWSLNGRSLTGTLASPSYNNDVEGKVTVNIRVDENGRVVSTSIGSPTTISDAETRNAAISAAKNTHFSSGNGAASGSITYNFKLK